MLCAGLVQLTLRGNLTHYLSEGFTLFIEHEGVTDMKGVIMAGGEGTRLRPLTSAIPKPMVPIMNKPVMEHIINLLKKYKVCDIAVTMCYLPNVIIDYFGSGKGLEVDLKYYIEEIPLGTGGSVLNAEDFLDETFIVVSGDALTDINLEKAIEFHKNKGSKATLVLKREPIPLEYGIVIVDDDGSVVKFLEKPSWGEVFSDTVNTGIYILEPEVLKYYRKGDNFDFSKDLFPRLLKDNIPMFGYVTKEYWNDIGDINSYRQTHIDILDKKVNIEFDAEEVEKGIIVGNNTFLPRQMEINPPVFIGRNCNIKEGAFIDSYTVLGDNCDIGENSSISRSIIWKNSHIGKSVECRGTIWCNKVSVGNNSSFFEGSVIGSECKISDRVTVKPNIKIWPDKNIKENVVVNRNIVWGTKAVRNIFGSKGISGELNIDITPEFSSLLGSAFGSQCSRDSTVIVSSDGTKAATLIRECVCSGLLSAGSRVICIGNAVTPISRFAVRFYRASGGIHVSQNYLDHNKIDIQIFNENGGNINRNLEKKIETVFIREDFERSSVDIIGDKIGIDNFTSFYIQSNITMIKNLPEIKQSNTRVIVTSPSSEEAAIALAYLKQLGCTAEVRYPNYKSADINSYITFASDLISNGNYNMGIVLSGNGENFILMDEEGQVINREKFTLLAALVCLKSGICKNIIIPSTVTSKVETMAKEHGAKIVRVKSSESDTINQLLNSVTPDDEHMLQYQLYFDGVAAVGRIISFLVENKTSIKTLIEELPEFHMKRVELSCDFKERGRVISELIKQNNNNKGVELFEGFKINTKEGWTLVLPDNEKPIFNIFSEGYTEEYAEELSGKITESIKEIIECKNKE